ncbi:hypothetical protein AMAG_17181 [Allomyces macrogynus ATCC 38327]|uniref:DUF4139 domain-containing protein n=1 Tax=Allomyces macrogynus (strain ATCC 38327) TaxID=578462 RepID=A0A0L0TE49_ALLM3|nr:hypothetical protein AMAG_17181 [Allomyces macrogynus ATCC 38327]|eukprot:KNE72951.1 hypothetical protein AMAG_17181 [Allomyces macrogynus ATCC 38327]
MSATASATSTAPHTVTVDAAKYPINKVTVYQDRAEVKRTLAALALPRRQGACVVRVRGISDAVDSDSIRVDGRGDAVIVDVRKLLTTERDIKGKNRERDALAEPSDAEGIYAPTSSRIQVVEVTLETKVTGDSKDETLEVDLDITYIVHRASWTPLYDLRVFSQSDSTKLTYAANVQQSTGEDWADVELTLSTAKVARSHGEAPAYKTRWSLSEYRPTPPPLRTRAGPPRPFPMPVMAYAAAPQVEQCVTMQASIVEYEEAAEFGALSPPAAEVAAGLTATAYRIPSAATIPSDDSQHRVTVALLDLPVTLDHTACPKLDPTAYLTAKITNKSAYTWLAGPANVFLDHAFVAKSRLSMVLPGAKLITSLGLDPAVAVQYRPVEKFTESRVSAGLFTSSASDRTAITYTQRTVLENKNTTKAVTLTLADQIPTTTSSDIVVTLLDPAEKQIAKLASRDAAVDTDGVKAAGAVPANGSNASLNRAPRAPNVVLYEDLGIVEWKIELKPGEKREVVLKYAVSYPKRMAIEGLDGSS